MKLRPFALGVFFWVLLATDCLLILFGAEQFRLFTRGLIVPVLFFLMLYQTRGTRHIKSKFIISFLLLFAWISDILLFNRSAYTGFASGLVFFLLAHVLYISFFLRIAPFRQRFVLMTFFSGFLIVVGLALFLFILWEGLEDMQLPVTLYCVLIGFMLFTAFNTLNFSRLKKIASQNFVPGALFFLVADTAFAIDKFNIQDVNSSILILSTYGMGHFLMITGAIRYMKK